ncbi:MAG: hypothetical protein AAFS10_21505 [Myxococcota bacterium]
MTVILKCSCTNAWQDRTYGEGFRVFNVSPKGFVRCTVCATTRTVDIERLRKANRSKRR